MFFHSNIQFKKNKLQHETQDQQEVYFAVDIHGGELQRVGKHKLYERMWAARFCRMPIYFNHLLRWWDMLQI